MGRQDYLLPGLLNLTTLRSQGCWPLFHEMGHQYQQYWYEGTTGGAQGYHRGSTGVPQRRAQGYHRGGSGEE